MSTKCRRIESVVLLTAMVPASGAWANAFFYDHGASYRVRTEVEQVHYGRELFAVRNWDSPPDGTAQDFDASNSIFHDDGAGFVASVVSEGSWAIDPTNAGLGHSINGVSFSGNFSASVVTGGAVTDEYAMAGIGMSLYVQFTSDMQWSFGADMFRNVQTAEGANAFYTGWNLQIAQLDNPTVPPGVPFGVEEHPHWYSELGLGFGPETLTGALPAGQYVFILNAGTAVEYHDLVPGAFESSFSIANGYLNFTSVPAPSSLGVLGLGVIGMRRRRR